MPIGDGAPETLFTDRLVIRKPHARDVDAWFRDIASDPQVTRYVGWPTHRSMQDTRDFLAFSDSVGTLAGGSVCDPSA